MLLCGSASLLAGCILMDSISKLQRCNSQVPSLWSSISCPSEPPDVGNWFSSYEYQSPDPDSNLNFEESAFRGRESEKDEEKGNKEANFNEIRTRDEVVAGEKPVKCSGTCVQEDKCNRDDISLTQSPDSSSSRSFLSEPPDIRNWFSSYVYESSVSDTSCLLKNVVSKENECEGDSLDYEIKNEDDDEVGSYHKNMRILQVCMQDSTPQHNPGPTNSSYEETLSMNHGSTGCNRAEHLMSLNIDINSDYDSLRPPELVDKNDIREVESKAKIQPDKLDMRTSSAERFLLRSSSCARNKENVGDMKSMHDKENAGDLKSLHGFVTARKNRCTESNDKNSWEKPEMSLRCTTNMGAASLAYEKQVLTKRKALTDATNLQQYDAMEITGKWQCPQKRKPHLGPALKQLRLERWVHRV